MKQLVVTKLRTHNYPYVFVTNPFRYSREKSYPLLYPSTQTTTHTQLIKGYLMLV